MVLKFLLPKVQSDLGILSHGRRISITPSNKEQSVTLTVTGTSRRLQNTYFHLRSFVCEFFARHKGSCNRAAVTQDLDFREVKKGERVFQVLF